MLSLLSYKQLRNLDGKERLFHLRSTTHDCGIESSYRGGVYFKMFSKSVRISSLICVRLLSETLPSLLRALSLFGWLIRYEKIKNRASEAIAVMFSNSLFTQTSFVGITVYAKPLSTVTSASV